MDWRRTNLFELRQLNKREFTGNDGIFRPD
jgi:hypothetical protein